MTPRVASYLDTIVETEASVEAPAEEERSHNWDTVKSVLREVIETVVLTLVIFFLIQTVVRNFRVVGTSMEPNLHTGEYLIVDKISYRLGPPQRGDVIVFEPPVSAEGDYVKRVIGLPGELVEVRKRTGARQQSAHRRALLSATRLLLHGCSPGWPRRVVRAGRQPQHVQQLAQLGYAAYGQSRRQGARLILAPQPMGRDSTRRAHRFGDGWLTGWEASYTNLHGSGA